MRKVTIKAVEAMKNGRNFRSGNTTVESGDPYVHNMYLHGNFIARYVSNTGDIQLFDAGWPTSTTRERLNGVLDGFNISKRIVQKSWKWYVRDLETMTDTEWDEQLTISTR